MPWASQEVPVVKILAAMESSPWGRKESKTTEHTCACADTGALSK